MTKKTTQSTENLATENLATENLATENLATENLADDTRVILAGRRPDWTAGIVNTPVWRASTILFDNVADLRQAIKAPDDGLYYGRRGTPTQWTLADAITSLEAEAAGTMLYPSGVAAVAGALLAVLKPGDELLMVDSAYDPSRALARLILAPMGITTRFYDPLIGSGIADLITDKTRAIFMESPGSLTFEIQDIPAIVAVARERGIITLIDNTWATPLLLPAMGLGVDISILSCTKYIVGHSDVMMGSVTANSHYWPAIRKTAQALGQCISPDDAWLAARGLRTMAVRLAQHGRSSLKIAQWLKTHPKVARVLHPALPDCPGHTVFQRDFKGSAGLFTIIMNGGDDQDRCRMIDALQLFGIGFSFGGYESLALPIDPEHYRTATQWQAEGPAIRLHIGLEDADDLMADLNQALALYAA